MSKDTLGATQLRDGARILKDLCEKIGGTESDTWLEEMKKFLRKEPCWDSDMIPIPLEWGSVIGEVQRDFLRENIILFNLQHGDGWRLPTHKELSSALRVMKPDGFVVGIYYWTSDQRTGSNDLDVVYTYDGHGGLGVAPGHSIGSERQKRPYLRLCRPVKIPGQ